MVVTLNPAARLPGDAGRRCLAARAVAEALATAPGYRPHPYPVTPYHPDYLQHADLAAAASARPASAWDGPPAARPRREMPAPRRWSRRR